MFVFCYWLVMCLYELHVHMHPYIELLSKKWEYLLQLQGTQRLLLSFLTVFWWDDILYVFDLHSFCLSFNTWAFRLWCLTECIGFEFWGLQWVLWWSIGLVWCFSIDYGNASRWIEQGGLQESCGITGICQPIKIHKPAHLTSEWWRFIKMIYFAMHICYPACFSHASVYVLWICDTQAAVQTGHLSCVCFRYGSPLILCL